MVDLCSSPVALMGAPREGTRAANATVLQCILLCAVTDQPAPSGLGGTTTLPLRRFV